MKLLIITQAIDVNNPVLGFFVRWVEEFSKKCEKIIVICLEKGEYHLPANVKVLSLGKECLEIKNLKLEITKKFIYVINFYRYIWHHRNDYETVFVHMNPIYVILGGLMWRLQNKKIGLWYTHKQVDLKLRLAEKLSDFIFTAAKESFNLKTNKLKIVGHGIPVDDFKNPGNIRKEKLFTIVSVGRITPIKNLDLLIDAARILKDQGLKFRLILIGGPIKKIDFEYLKKIKNTISNYKLESYINLVGAVSNKKLKEYYWKSDLSINLCPTGGIDKVVLESIASGLPVLVSNRAFIEYFEEYESILIFQERNAFDLSQKIMNLMNNTNIHMITSLLLKNIKEKVDLNKLINVLVENLSI